jgi:hypothetical protein
LFRGKINGQWKITKEGKISVPPFNHHYPPQYGVFIKDPNQWQWANGDYGQKSYYVISSLVDYYRYTGDPAAIAHINMQVEHILKYTLTPTDHEWPNFPISVPVKGRGYHYYDPTGFIQLDISAQQGLAVLKAYQLTGESRWFDAAKLWADAFAANRNTNPKPGDAPWGRYATEDSSAPWDQFFPNQPKGWGTRMTGGVALVLEFLDEIVRLGYTGNNNEILKTQEQCKAYLRDYLLPNWTANEVWGRHYWDNPAIYQSLITTDAAVRCFMKRPNYFTSWQNDVRNVMSLFFNHTGVFEGSRADTYHGAWAYPESLGCCSLSLDYSPMEMAAAFAQYGVLTNSDWARELARRQIILTTYHVHETGVVEDNIDGGFIVAGDWFKIVHPMTLKHVLDTMGWLPETLGANRENHIMRSSAVVNYVTYGAGDIRYSTFDAPENTVDILRLAFAPELITADGEKLMLRKDLENNGYTVIKLSNKDCIISVRHDGKKKVVITGDDSQQVTDDDNITYYGKWNLESDTEDYLNTVHLTSENNASAVYNFTGNRVCLLGRVTPEGGLADVYINGIKQLVGIDCWNPHTRHQQTLYYKNGLSNGSHKLKIVAKGSGNPHSSGTNIYIDAVQFSDATDNVGFGQGGGPTRAQRMIFGYPKRTPYVDSLGNKWFPGTEFIARTGLLSDSVVKTWWQVPLNEAIANTCNAELYRYGIHWPEFWINVTTGPGKYYAKLKFAASANRMKKIDSHSMEILINGKKVASRVNIAATAHGINKAVDLVFNDIAPQNGIIEIRLVGNGGMDAFLQALEIGQGNGGTGTKPVSVQTPRQSKPKKQESAEEEGNKAENFIPGADGNF